MSDLVVVTDGAGFLGQWCVVTAIQNHLRVRAVATTPDDVATIMQGASSHVDVTGVLETVVLDPSSPTGWADELAGARFVIHNSHLVAEPELTAGVNQEFTTRLLEAAKQAGVERVAMTSSLSAALPSGDEVDIDEGTWTDPTTPSEGGTLAAIERSAIECADRLGLELVTLLPGVLLGVPADGAQPAGLELVADLVLGKVNDVPKLAVNVTDVRDAAHANVVALMSPRAAGRYCLPGGSYWLAELARVLKHRLGDKGRAVPTTELSGWKRTLLGWLTPSGSRTPVGTPHKIAHSARRAVRDLDWSPRDTDDTLVATAEFVLAQQSAR